MGATSIGRSKSSQFFTLYGYRYKDRLYLREHSCISGKKFERPIYLDYRSSNSNTVASTNNAHSTGSDSIDECFVRATTR